MDKAQFESQLAGKIVLADFSAAWCAPCRAMAPVMEELSRAYRGRADIMQINIDSEKELATQLMVHSIPTLILFDNGQEKKRFVGLQSRSALEEGLNALL
jgi:thioredoxin 1